MTYFHSTLLPSNVLAPQTIAEPLPLKDLIAFIDLPLIASTFKFSCSLLVIFTVGSITEFKFLLAGAIHTPCPLSVLVYNPAIAGATGRILNLSAIVFFNNLYSGQEFNPPSQYFFFFFRICVNKII